MKNKIAVVTGAGSGIGRGIALALGKEKYDVVVVDLNLENGQKVADEVAKTGTKAVSIKCDVSSSSEVKNLFERIAKDYGQVDVMVNNAGIFPFVPFENMSESDWDKVLNVNLKSVFLCSQAATKIMPEGGRIINTSSIASMVGFEGLAHYCASKGGINGLVRALALELAPKKITVNAVAPGAIRTPGAQSTEEQEKQTISAIPLARMGEPEDIANTVVFLASDKSDYITGQVFVVDGGWTLR